MTSKYLATVLAVMCCALTSISQVVNPGGGIYAISDIPGLRTELDSTLTNVHKGADTGTATGNVVQTTRQAEINFPTVPPFVTNFVHGTVTIDPSGTTLINFFHTFTNTPFLTLTPVGTNITQLLTSVRLTLTTSNATFVVISSGAIVTNAYLVDWQANDGLGLSTAAPALNEVGGSTNIYQNNGGPNGMNAFYFPVGHGVGKWLVSDATGRGSWQNRAIVNLIDGEEVFKRDGSVFPTANLNINGKDLYNIGRIQLTTGAGLNKVLLSDASGYGAWDTLPSWSPASTPLNMNGNAITYVGPLDVDGVETHAGTATFSGTVNQNSTVNIAGTLTTTGLIRANRTGGSYASPAFQVAGYSRFNGLADCRAGIYASAISGSTVGIYNYGVLANAGGILAGDASWMSSWSAIPSGTIAAKYGILVSPNNSGGTIVFYADRWGNMVATGTKSFRIQHPVDANKYLFHVSVESPSPELIYRGKTKLVDGTASVNLNTYYALIPHTLDTILTNMSVCVYNNAGWTQVRCKTVSGVSFEIEAKDATCTDEVEWTVIAQRCDSGVSRYEIEANK